MVRAVRTRRVRRNPSRNRRRPRRARRRKHPCKVHPAVVVSRTIDVGQRVKSPTRSRACSCPCSCSRSEASAARLRDDTRGLAFGDIALSRPTRALPPPPRRWTRRRSNRRWKRRPNRSPKRSPKRSPSRSPSRRRIARPSRCGRHAPELLGRRAGPGQRRRVARRHVREAPRHRGRRELRIRREGGRQRPPPARGHRRRGPRRGAFALRAARGRTTCARCATS